MGSSFITPMFRAGTSSGPPAVILFTDTLLTQNLRLFSRNIFSSTKTTISGFEWKPHGRTSCRIGADLPLLRGLSCSLDPGYALSFAAGIGSGHLYTSEALSFSRPGLDLNLAYVAADDGFQRSLAEPPLHSQLHAPNSTEPLPPTGSTTP